MEYLQAVKCNTCKKMWKTATPHAGCEYCDNKDLEFLSNAEAMDLMKETFRKSMQGLA
jgi:Zn finger protein HypA/HybF involved in hydrogenase expression